jgi:methylenetetrahydrofolate reductase (NADPH)
VEVAAELAQELLDLGAPGLHFYTLNRSTSTREVVQALGLGSD